MILNEQECIKVHLFLYNLGKDTEQCQNEIFINITIILLLSHYSLLQLF